MNELGMVDGIDRKEQCSGELDVTASGQSVGAADSTSERRNENAIGEIGRASGRERVFESV